MNNFNASHFVCRIVNNRLKSKNYELHNNMIAMYVKREDMSEQAYEGYFLRQFPVAPGIQAITLKLPAAQRIAIYLKRTIN